MTIAASVKEFLEKNKIPYEVIPHRRVFTSLTTATVEHVVAKQQAKVIMVKADGKNVMVVIPADHNLNLLKLKEVLGAKDVRMEREREFENLFWDCELGAMPPFGSLYHIRCYLDVRFIEDKFVYFNAGSHEEAVKVAMPDFVRLAEAEIADLAVEERIKTPRGV